MRSCNDVSPSELLDAVEQFNRHEWFDCHETLEELWVGERGEMRDFYQGLLQVAVALHHWREGNFKGAVLLLQKGADYLRRVPAVCQGVAVAEFVAAADRFRQALTLLTEKRMEEVDPRLIPVLHTLSPREGNHDFG